MSNDEALPQPESDVAAFRRSFNTPRYHDHGDQKNN